MAEDNDGFGPAICHTQILNVIKFGHSDVKTFILSFSYFIKQEHSGSPYRIIKLLLCQIWYEMMIVFFQVIYNAQKL